MRYCIFLIVVATICCGHYLSIAQPGGLRQFYFFDYRSVRFSSVFYAGENHLVTVGQLGVDSLYLGTFFVADMDTFGNVLKLTIVGDPAREKSIHIDGHDPATMLENGDLLISGISTQKELFVARLNNDREIIYFQFYEHLYTYRQVYKVIASERHVFLIGLIQHKITSDFDFFVQLNDMDGNKMWEKTYGSPNRHDVAVNAIIDSSGITLLASESYDPDPFVLNDNKHWHKFMHIDTHGVASLLWRSDELNVSSYGGPGGLIRSGDRYYYFARTAFQVAQYSYRFGCQVVCMDMEYNVIWKRDYEDHHPINGFWNMAMSADGYLYTVGDIHDGIVTARVYKLDPENGDVIWMVREPGFSYSGFPFHNMRGVTTMPSGSVIAAGCIDNPVNYHKHGILLKISPDGCIDTLCTTSMIDAYLSRQGGISVYPNPAQDFLVFDTGEQTIPGTAELYDLHGRCVQTMPLQYGVNTMTLDKNILTTGLYVWRVVTHRGEQVASGKVLIN